MQKLRVGEDVYEYDGGSFTNKEGMEIERVSGVTFDQWNKSLIDGSARAFTALIYILKRRENPRIRFDDIEFKFGDVEHIPDPDADADAEPASGQSAEIVPGGLQTEFNTLDPTEAPEASTPGGSNT